MKFDKDMYTEMFSQVHSSFTFNKERFEVEKKRKKKAVKRMIAMAASLAIIAGIGGTVYASRLFGIKGLLIKNDSIKTPVVTTLNPGDDGNEPDVTVSLEEEVAQADMINMSGWADSNEGKAVKEWTEFTDSYDQDNAILSQVGNDPTGLEDKYGMYLVYSQEMADKLDEITAKYHLKLHKSMELYETDEELTARVGNFLSEKTYTCGSYIYNDDSFAFDGNATLDSQKVVDYQFSDLKKGVFTDTILNIGNSNEYEEWNYQTKNGDQVYLALGKEKGLIITERPESFVAVNVLAGTETGFLDVEGKITKEDLEELADSFYYSVLK